MTTMLLKQNIYTGANINSTITITPPQNGVIKKIGIQGPAGLKFAFNNGENNSPMATMYLGATEIYEVDLLNLGVVVNSISLLSVPSTANDRQIIVDYVVEVTT